MNYYDYLIKRSKLVNESLRPRFPGETKDAWFRERMKAKEELENFEESYPEFTERYNFNKKH